MYIKVEISAETREQAEQIQAALLEKKLSTGGQIVAAPAKFLWKGQITDMDYFTISGFTLDKHKEAIIDVVKSLSVEEVPMVSFVEMDGNKELLDWIGQTVA